MTQMKRGLYISIEGIDGSGKSSIISDLAVRRPENTYFTRMPGGTEFGESLRSACRSADIDETTQVLFYGALNHDASVRLIEPTLSAGTSVVVDRGWLSTLVYQAMPAGKEKLLLSIMDDEAIPVPDLLIYLNVSMAESMHREEKRGLLVSPGIDSPPDDRYSKFDKTAKERIKEGYDIFLGLTPDTTHYQIVPDDLRPRDDFAVMWKLRPRIAKNIVVIDANRPYDQVLREVNDIINQYRKEYDCI